MHNSLDDEEDPNIDFDELVNSKSKLILDRSNECLKIEQDKQKDADG